MMGSTLNLAYSGGGGAGVVTLDEFCSFKSSGTVDHGTATALSSARWWGSSAALEDICFLFGGSSQYHTTNSNSGVVDSYTSERVRGSASNLSQARMYSSATANKNYALIFGGWTAGPSTIRNNVDAYNGSGVRTTATSLPTAVENTGAGTVGNYSLCIGGYINDSYTPAAGVTVYNSDLVQSSAPSLSVARFNPMVASNGETLLAMGGAIARNGATTAVDVYTAALVHSTATAISQARATGAGAMAGDYFICAGGGYGFDSSGLSVFLNVDFFDADLVHSIGTVLNEARRFLGGASVRAGAIICGGLATSNSSAKNNAEMYDRSMVHTTLENLNTARGAYLSVVSFPDADTVLVLGGGYYNSALSTVDYYVVPPAVFTELTVPAGSRYRFDGIHDAEQTAAATTKLSYAEAISGYIKLPSLTLGGVHENPTLVASI